MANQIVLLQVYNKFQTLFRVQALSRAAINSISPGKCYLIKVKKIRGKINSTSLLIALNIHWLTVITYSLQHHIEMVIHSDKGRESMWLWWVLLYRVILLPQQTCRNGLSLTILILFPHLEAVLVAIIENSHPFPHVESPLPRSAQALVQHSLHKQEKAY